MKQRGPVAQAAALFLFAARTKGQGTAFRFGQWGVGADKDLKAGGGIPMEIVGEDYRNANVLEDGVWPWMN